MSQPRVVAVLLTVALTVLAAPTRVEAAPFVLVSGDINIINAVDGSAGAPIDPGNRQLFTNLVQAGDHVLILSRNAIPESGFAPTLLNLYGSLPGVTASLVLGNLTPGLLDGVDLLIDIRPASAIDADGLAGLLKAGGSIFFLGDGTGGFNQGINGSLASLGSNMRLVETTFPGGFHAATGDQIAVDPLTVGVNSVSYAFTSAVINGTPLVRDGVGTPFIAYETYPFPAPVPEPATLSLLAIGSSIYAFAARRRHS